MLPSNIVYREYTDCSVCVYVCTVLMKGPYVCCDVGSRIMITPDDVTKCQNWLKMRGRVVSVRAMPTAGSAIDQLRRTDVTTLNVASRKECMVMCFD